MSTMDEIEILLIYYAFLNILHISLDYVTLYLLTYMIQSPQTPLKKKRRGW